MHRSLLAVYSVRHFKGEIMSKAPLIKPVDLTLKSIDGEEKHFRISRVPATRGREIFTQYLPTAIPKVGDYKSNEKLMHMLIGYIDVRMANNEWMRLCPVTLDAHVTDFEMLGMLELKMIGYNTNFFNPERLSKGLARFNQTLPERVMSMLNRLSGQLSAKAKQASKS